MVDPERALLAHRRSMRFEVAALGAVGLVGMRLTSRAGLLRTVGIVIVLVSGALVARSIRAYAAKRRQLGLAPVSRPGEQRPSRTIDRSAAELVFIYIGILGGASALIWVLGELFARGGRW